MQVRNDYKKLIEKCEANSHLISMISIDEIIRFGHSMGLNGESKVLDLCCGYGEMLKILHEAFDIYGAGVDITSEFIDEGNNRLQSNSIKKVKLILGDILKYETSEQFDVVILSETFGSIAQTIAIGEKYLKNGGILVYCKVYSKVPNPPQELIDFDEEVLPLEELNKIFNSLSYYITHMASDTNSDWERYITWSARRDINALRKNPNNKELKAWINKWYNMYFVYRRPYEGQALFGLEKL